MSDTEVARVSTVVSVSLKPPIALCLIPNKVNQLNNALYYVT